MITARCLCEKGALRNKFEISPTYDLIPGKIKNYEILSGEYSTIGQINIRLADYGAQSATGWEYEKVVESDGKQDVRCFLR